MGAQAIGSLFVALGLDTAAFTAGISAVQAKNAAFAAHLAKGFRVVALAAAGAGTALAAMGLKGAAEIDRTAKAARRLDATVTGYRALEMVADDAGVSLSSLADNVQTMNREIAKGGKEATAALSALGLKASDLAGLDVDEKMALIADRVKAMGLSAAAASALMQKLGVRNREMALLMIGGGDAIRQARQDVIDYGLAISQVDASRIEKARDEIKGLADIGTYLGDRLALAVVPGLAAMANAMTESLRTGGLLRGVLDAILGAIGRMTAYGTAAVLVIGSGWVKAFVAARLATMSLSAALVYMRGALIRTGWGALVVILGEVIYQLYEVETGSRGVSSAFIKMKAVAQEVIGRITSLFDLIPLSMAVASNKMHVFFSTALLNMTSVFMEFTWQVAEGLNALFGTNLKGAGLGLAMLEMRDDIAVAEGAAASAAGSMERIVSNLTAPLAALNMTFGIGLSRGDKNLLPGDAIAEVADATDDFGGAAGGAGGKASELAKVLADLNEEATRLHATMGMNELDAAIWEKQREAGVSAASAAGQAIALQMTLIDRLQKMKDAGERGRDAMRGLFEAMLEGADAARQALISLLAEIAKVQFAKGMLALLGMTGWGSKLIGGVGQLLGQNANGTNNWRGGLTQVNERGGEIMNLPRGTQIIPHDISKRMADRSGQGAIAVHVTAAFDETGNLYVKQVAQETSAAQIGAYHRQLPALVERTINYPRRRD